MKLGDWPVIRQATGPDRKGLGSAARSPHSAALSARVTQADRVVKSVCPYCAVGCGQNVYVKDERVTQIEGDPDSPVSRGRLCPKGSASLQLTTGSARRYDVLYRPPTAPSGSGSTSTPPWRWSPIGSSRPVGAHGGGRRTAGG